MIYFIGREKFYGVENIILNEIKFFEFNVNLNDFDCLIISSKNSIKALMQSHSTLNFNINLYAVGAKSAQFAKSVGFVNVKYPSCAYGKNLAEEFMCEFKNKRCLYLRAKKISSCIDTYLLNQGINLRQIVAYENVALNPQETIKLKHPAVFIFCAPSSIEQFLKFFTFKKEDKVVVIGQSTASKLKNFKNLYICKKQDLNSCLSLAKSLDV
ncbi:uroporphyrinogen-III synthase [Campylobacter insulaenigrae]|uniref:Uroporphyrinogen-III synthase n=1 Tax=Campylobacter insulaenigrae TaxID=260714 RepID=A0ABY3G3T3_9BACT|nr:uroporphyrinogen-III synthase [Campylobacter insulaenigrae]MCR6574405.1 uroporphyrinogen-III synthase [Campylobacter insulaenigrae]MCR6575982.1 uroporphyrinogen-III synthase [Campylobacter insulaenigrae]MCR6579073.1 uroporphyrinogen-III synthase [Campylobacter insulaenigrae]MCR6580707.1 uroporphyrinogen-III synthase [Campylobacter insulaenigrae]MCR6584836.1 uroporphyrinogen-III synthase [Campylobacter insulaenigrae]